MNKIAAYTFSIASLGMFSMVILYMVVLQPPAGDWPERVAHIKENWPLLATHWRIEFLCAVALSWGALHFSSRSISLAQVHGHDVVSFLRVVLPSVCVGFRVNETSRYSGTACHAAVSSQCMVRHSRVVKALMRGGLPLAQNGS